MIVFKIDAFSFFVCQTLSSQNGHTHKKFCNYPSFLIQTVFLYVYSFDIHIKSQYLIGFCIQQNQSKENFNLQL